MHWIKDDLIIYLFICLVYLDISPPPDEPGRGEAPGVDAGGHKVRAECVGAQHRAGHPLPIRRVDGGRVRGNWNGTNIETVLGIGKLVNTYNSQIPEGMFCGGSLEIRSAFV